MLRLLGVSVRLGGETFTIGVGADEGSGKEDKTGDQKNCPQHLPVAGSSATDARVLRGAASTSCTESLDILQKKVRSEEPCKRSWGQRSVR